ncbi:VOC family protein [Pelagibacteraceae bacterium]|nr:VOC family protein [Pelagibacteraceae bacterium]
MTKEVILNFDLYRKFRSEYSPDNFHHVAFKTLQYDKMVNFYEKLFGCKPLYKSNDIAFLAFDEEHHRVAIANTKPGVDKLNFFVKLIAQFKEWLNRSTPSAVGLDHISYQLNPIDKWFDFYLKAKERGLKPYWTINHGWITGMYYKDPDNNLIEIFFEHWQNEKEFKHEVSARGFPEEPVGTNMDIDILYDMFKKGESFENLTKKGNTVPEGKKPVSGIQAAINMRKKFK